MPAVRVLDPLKKCWTDDEEEEPVIVCYDRIPSYEEKYDYLLYFSEGGFYIPSKGEAVFADKNQKFRGALSIGEQGSSSMLTLIRKHGGGIAYFENKPGKDFSQFFLIMWTRIRNCPVFSGISKQLSGRPKIHYRLWKFRKQTMD